MEKAIRLTSVRHTGTVPASAPLYTAKAAAAVRRFHRSVPGYAATPLRNLQGLAKAMGLCTLWVKDESYRFGLNAFKSLGGSWCIANVMAERLENIRKLGAKAEITPWNYDATVQFAAKEAKDTGAILTQDTAWLGYERIPGLIMQGYLTMAEEALEAVGSDEPPTHVFLQAGVGSMAGALAAYFADRFGEKRPTVIVVEPHAADCIYRTAAAADGELHAVTGSMPSIMAGLCCGVPCTTAWALLREYADFCLAIPDSAAAKGMRVLGNPLPGDERIISGESGASTAGALADIMMKPEYEALRRDLGLGADSRVLCFSTEGDTDRTNYRSIVWDGLWPSF